ncbi:Hypothetical protein CAP_3860 [Chondromyces apiculatus DSM 436]|uniref:Uncharacterized protein n=1 Tax=Chondromyces apiculatus DSM 436 TaxID=1192034 RepID=A0A017T6H5_9BACT|nr:Hypothetical protein CAP_3860 [Chondromyces apiculatus DSM 436]
MQVLPGSIQQKEHGETCFLQVHLLLVCGWKLVKVDLFTSSRAVELHYLEAGLRVSLRLQAGLYVALEHRRALLTEPAQDLPDLLLRLGALCT